MAGLPGPWAADAGGFARSARERNAFPSLRVERGAKSAARSFGPVGTTAKQCLNSASLRTRRKRDVLANEPADHLIRVLEHG